MRLLILVFGILVIGADQWLKSWISSSLAIQQQVTLVPGWLSLTNIRNTGAAWSSFEGQTWFFYLITIIALAIVIPLLIKAYRQKTSVTFYTGLVLIIAGTIGNFIDRASQGYVVDMFQLDFVNFPIFNIADMALTVGVILLFIYVIFLDKDTDTK
ncbi:signal peptidase II [Lapidilactobacillus gannanensis]|uniref:Lipoprotein signal peptidase n=1 Tax=Lapidilactobacillus gannanensis TaxID=2486002 RepID=A0ABW4BQD6_9LACO|nr:signal peptidase II [Lapidilactobacillus gannanensis]